MADFVFFWRPTQVNGEFGQWYSSPFTIDDVEFSCAEQYMMYRKVMLFGDEGLAKKILQTKSPKVMKSLGRKTSTWDERLWHKWRLSIVVKANMAKFGQDQDLMQCLLATGSKTLVEASPRDKIWGIGISASNPDAKHPNKWKGQNLLGVAITYVRDHYTSRNMFPHLFQVDPDFVIAFDPNSVVGQGILEAGASQGEQQKQLLPLIGFWDEQPPHSVEAHGTFLQARHKDAAIANIDVADAVIQITLSSGKQMTVPAEERLESYTLGFAPTTTTATTAEDKSSVRVFHDDSEIRPLVLVHLIDAEADIAKKDDPTRFDELAKQAAEQIVAVLETTHAGDLRTLRTLCVCGQIADSESDSDSLKRFAMKLTLLLWALKEKEIK
eukprot:c4197_g1_i1.p1 GENE.c4197_g1_i1~~c4197_g1_i1.p1  ORF type:complete len:383 (+),score=95.99 c4197_g1_i1:109-1257(+)